MCPPDRGHRLPASTPFSGSRFRDSSPFCFLPEGTLTMPGCSPERELGVRQQRRGGVWWIWLGCVCSSSAGTRSLSRVRGRCGARMWLLFLCGFKCFFLCACEVSEAAFDFTPGWEMTGECFQLDCKSWTAPCASFPHFYPK